MIRLFATFSALLFTSLPSFAQETAPEQALEHAVDEAVVEEVHQAHDGGGLPQFNPETWASQIFWLAISFAFLYFFFSKFILPSLTATIEKRTDKIQGDIKAAENLSSRAEQIRLAYEAEFKMASGKATADIKAIDDEAKAKLANSLTEFRARYEAEIKTVEQRLEDSKEAVLGDMNKLAAEIAAQAAQKIAGISADPSQADSIVQSIKNKAA
ncbi:MAG: hypothetical protein DI586_08295 [Micavibrio aeruginosavorus]|uniref:ATP synthase subunit b n=1 Tax=Micavibrio aeruginosavorus TaxID=349221 RepID=A0A2W5HA65_9BACT|nr:MAG: hypothetical protein DI586_08295 [Micavibrio aeruginosavorus]